MKLGDECHKNVRKLQNHLSDVSIGKNTNIVDKFQELESKKLYADILQNPSIIAYENKLEELNELQERYKDTTSETYGHSTNLGDSFKEQFIYEEKRLADFYEGLYKMSGFISKNIDIDSGIVKNIVTIQCNFLKKG